MLLCISNRVSPLAIAYIIVVSATSIPSPETLAIDRERETLTRRQVNRRLSIGDIEKSPSVF